MLREKKLNINFQILIKKKIIKAIKSHGGKLVNSKMLYRAIYYFSPNKDILYRIRQENDGITLTKKVMLQYPPDEYEIKISEGSDFKTIHIPPGLELLKDNLTKISIWYNPATKISEHQYTRDEIKKAFWRQGGDTLNIPDAIYELTNLKTIKVLNFYNQHVLFSDKISKLKNLEEIDMNTKSKECEIRLESLFPNADID